MSANTQQDLQFFGMVTATISHDLKNVLAVINEGAGLLDDLSQLAEQGRPIEPQRLASVARSILGQVQRGDAIIKTMNTFAHSVDEPTRDIDVAEMLTLMAALCRRPAGAKGASIAVEPCQCSIITNPYALEQTLHTMISCALDVANNGTVLTLRAEQSATGNISIQLKGLEEKLQISQELQHLAEDIGAAVSYQEDALTLNISGHKL